MTPTARTAEMDATLTLMRWAGRMGEADRTARDLSGTARAAQVERSGLAAEIRDVARRRLSEAMGCAGHAFDDGGYCRTCYPLEVAA